MQNQSNIARGLLATALVPILTYNGNKVLLRALLDQGSTANLLSERGAQIIRCNREKSLAYQC